MSRLLSVDKLSINIHKDNVLLNAVDELSFDLGYKKVLGIVGESGCGKSLTNLAIMKLLAPNIHTTGRITFDNHDLSSISNKAFNELRGNDIAMIFQDSISGLNPLIKVGKQVAEVLIVRKKMNKSKAKTEVLSLFEKVKMAQPQIAFNKYPHELSGGQRQRIMIALAIACSPKLLIADEPTTALDVTTQLQILDLLLELKDQLDMSMIIVSHDIGVIRKMCDDVLVMYAGRVVEKGRCHDVLKQPKHPYTLSLLHSIPSLASKGQLLECIEGLVPSLEQRTSDHRCAFAMRCKLKCNEHLKEVPMVDVGENHQVLCHRKGVLSDA